MNRGTSLWAIGFHFRSIRNSLKAIGKHIVNLVFNCYGSDIES